MAKATQVPDRELQEFQDSLKFKLRYLTSFFSIILIVLGLYLLLSGLFGLAVVDEATDNTVLVDQITEQEQGGKIDGAVSTGRIEAATLSAQEKSEANQSLMSERGKWIATDYAQGDIGLGEYTVKRGDTLWEIAEASYGSGFEWKKILENNKDQIGFLPDGSQALIIPGQVLKIVK
ncbi:MAG TPA: LysM peptidoglycan-binding domain-containing protein [Candidatus Dojkabacteria bacterium]|nr:LysM peptidoglycan-binding domain-containing protein [Candidatus Dojkabacteria bacterium]